MRISRVMGLALAAGIVGTVVWKIQGLLDGQQATVEQLPTVQTRLPDAQLNDERMRQQTEAANQRAEELAAALEEAERALAEERARQADSDATLDDVSASLVAARARATIFPEGLGRDYIDLDTLLPAFNSQDIDFEWALPAESALTESVWSTIADSQIAVSAPEVSCRSNICRLRLTHFVTPNSTEQYQELTRQMQRLSRRAVDDSPHASMAIIHYRIEFPGELPSSEIYFFRDGSAPWMEIIDTPDGRVIWQPQSLQAYDDNLEGNTA